MIKRSEYKSLHRGTVLWLDHEDHRDEIHMEWFQSWLNKWGDKVQVAGYDTGGWEHFFDVQGTEEAIKDIPQKYHCGSEWVDRSPHRWGSKKSQMGDPRDADWVEYGANQILE